MYNVNILCTHNLPQSTGGVVSPVWVWDRNLTSLYVPSPSPARKSSTLSLHTFRTISDNVIKSGLPIRPLLEPPRQGGGGHLITAGWGWESGCPMWSPLMPRVVGLLVTGQWGQNSWLPTWLHLHPPFWGLEPLIRALCTWQPRLPIWPLLGWMRVELQIPRWCLLE